ncbi:MAG: hypothetical protein JWN41_414 [Thermoleophilia bacterium]|nr:hypothetical protein [Thermoleophilia bacterium]
MSLPTAPRLLPKLLPVIVALVMVLAIAVPTARAELAEGYYGSNQERAEGSTPSLGGKMISYSEYVDKNGFPPQNLILGTSRGMMLDPRLVKQLSGRSAFNSSVSDGAARELYAMASFSELIAPGRAPHLVVMFDIEGLDRRTPTKRVLKTMEAEQRIRAACKRAAKCTDYWRKGALKIVADARAGHAGRPALNLTQRPDGMILYPHLARLEREGADFTAMRNHRIQIRVASYKPGGGFDKLMPIPEAATRDMLKLANAWGDTPTVVITSMHPDCIRICGPAGWSAHHRDALRFFKQLAKTYDFDLHDFSDPKSFGGSAGSFYEDIHLRPAGAALVIKKIDSFGGFDVDPRAPRSDTDASASVKTALVNDTVSSDADGSASDVPDADTLASLTVGEPESAQTTGTHSAFLERALSELHQLTRQA